MTDVRDELEAQAQAAAAAFEDGRIEEAQAALEAVLTIDGSHGLALYTLGSIHLGRGAFEAAELCVLKALLFGGGEASLLLDAAEIAIHDQRFAHARVFIGRYQGQSSEDPAQRRRAARMAQVLLEVPSA